MVPPENASTIALKIIENSKNTLCGEIHSLLRGINAFTYEEKNDFSFLTDGNKIYYSAEYILKSFKDNQNSVNRMLLHTLFHCLFLHILTLILKTNNFGILPAILRLKT